MNKLPYFLLFILLSLAFQARAQDAIPSDNLVPITLQNASQIQLITTLGRGYITALAWSPDDASLAVGTSINLEIYDAQVLTAPPRSLLTTPAFVSKFAYSPDGSLLAMSALDGLRLLDAVTGEELAFVALESSLESDIVFSPEGETVVWSGFPGVMIVDVNALLEAVPVAADTDCMIIANSGNVNVRGGAGTDFARIGVLANGVSTTGLEQTTGSDGYVWWRVAGAGLPEDGGWVRSDLVTTTGCDSLPVSSAPRMIQPSDQVNWGYFLQRDVAVNWDEGWLATTNYGGHTDSIRLWDLATGAPRGEITTRYVPMELGRGLKDKSPFAQVIDLFPDGRLWALGAAENNSGYSDYLRVWDLLTNVERVLFRSEGSIWGAAASPDGSLIAAGGSLYRPYQSLIWLIDTATGEIVHTFTGHVNLIEYLAFSHDGSRLASATHDELRVWDMATFDQTIGLGGYQAARSVSPDLRWTAIVAQTGTSEQLIVHDNVKGESRNFGTFDQLSRLEFSPDSSVLAVADRQEITWWSMETGRQIGRNPLVFNESWESLDWNAYQLAWSADGQLLAFGSTNNSVEIWNIQTNRRVTSFVNDQRFAATSLVFNADASLLATTSDDGRVRIWDMATSTLRSTLRPPENSAYLNTTFHPDGERLALGMRDGFEIWNLRLGGRVTTIRGISGVLNADWSLAVGSSMDELVIYEMAGGTVVTRIPSGHTRFLTETIFADGDKAIVTNSADGTIRVWGVPE